MGTISRIGEIDGINGLKNTTTNAINNFIDNVSNQFNKQASPSNKIETEEIDLNYLPTNDFNQPLTQDSASNINWDKYMEDVNRQAEENDKCIELYTNLKEEINNTIESSQAGYDYETVSGIVNQPGVIDSDVKNKDEMLDFYYNFTELSKYGINNREELDNYMDMLDKNINSMQYNKKSTENFKQLVPYLKIMSGEDYKKYKNKDVNSEDLSSWVIGILNGNNSTTTNNPTNWGNSPRGIKFTASYKVYNNKTNENISPVDFLRMVNGLAPQLKQFVTTTDIEDLELLNLLLEASEINPDLLKCYNYLFYNQGKEEADKFLKAAEEEINKTVGIKRAGEFLSKLPKDKNIKDMTDGEIDSYINELYSNGVYEVQNEDYGGIRDILVALKGGKDGIRQYFEGLKGWLTESTSRSALDFEKMYILYALMPESDKKKMGLIGEDGKSIIDPTILDFSQNYSDKLGITDNIYEISTSIGNMVPSMIVGSLLPGIGSIGAGTISVFLSSGGNARREGLINGMDATKATFYGIANGMTEAALVELLSTLPGLRGKEEQIKTLKQLALAMVKEGKEEGLEEIASILIDYMFTGEMVTLEEATLRVGKSALYGAITSGIMNTPGVALNTANQVIIDMNDTAFKSKAKAILSQYGIEATDTDIDAMMLNSNNSYIEIENITNVTNTKKISEEIINSKLKIEDVNKVIEIYRKKGYNDSQISEIVNGLDIITQYELNKQYGVKINLDEKEIKIIDYFQTKAAEKLKTIFEQYVSEEKIKEVTKKYLFLRKEEFAIQSLQDGNYIDGIAGYNRTDGVSIVNLENSYYDVIRTSIHESIHSISRDGNLSGFKTTSVMRGFNEACTELLNERTIGREDYIDNSGYKEIKQTLKKLIDNGIFNIDDLTKAYFEHNNGYLSSRLQKFGGNYQQIMQLFNDSVNAKSDIIRTKAKRELDRIITRMLMLKKRGLVR